MKLTSNLAGTLKEPKQNLSETLQVFFKYYIYTMEAKSFDAIPVEAVAPATPERVTSDVPKTKSETAKNPGRVASGKRLAERNRFAREAKKQAEAQKPTTSTTTDATSTTTNTTEQSSDNIGQDWWFDCLRFGCLLPT